jgi:fructosamine-3-kinase
MRLPQAAADWLRQGGYGEVTAVHPVGGGCINAGARLETSSEQSFFLKQNDAAPPGMFAREQEGLRALEVPGAPRVPASHLAEEHFLLLEDLRPAPRAPGYWEAFGRALASLHQQTGPRFGFHHDNYLGSTPQPNPWTQDGYDFFAEQRLRYQARLAHRRGLLDTADVRRVDDLAARLPELVPVQPASLIHGDLWSGNAMTDEAGSPALIDPATHFGWAEAELGMTALFGGFPEAFYAAYVEAHPLTPGWRRPDWCSEVASAPAGTTAAGRARFAFLVAGFPMLSKRRRKK